jgi:hypothetical protein
MHQTKVPPAASVTTFASISPGLAGNPLVRRAFESAISALDIRAPPRPGWPA